jgi:hypothetical protein
VIATIVDWTRLGKVVVYSLIAGIGIAVIFGAGVSSAAALLESARRRGGASFAWGAVTVICVVCALGAVAYGIVVMAKK